MEPSSRVATVKCHPGDYPYVSKIIKKLEKENKLPPDGELHFYTREQAAKMIEELKKNAPDCTNWGYTKAVIKAGVEPIVKAFESKGKAKILKGLVKQLGPDAYVKFGNLIYTQDEFSDKIAKDFLKETLPAKASTLNRYLYPLEVAAETIFKGMDSYYAHKCNCDIFKGGIAIIEAGAKETIATLIYKTDTVPEKSKPTEKVQKVCEIKQPETIKKPSQANADGIIKKSIQADKKPLTKEELAAQTKEVQEEILKEQIKEDIAREIQQEKIQEEIKREIQKEKAAGKKMQPAETATTAQEVYEKVAKTIKEVKEKLLPEDTDVQIENPFSRKKGAVRVTHPVGGRVRAGVEFKPRRLKDTRVTASYDLTQAKKGSNDLNTTVGANINPRRLKDSNVSLGTGNNDFSVGINVGRKLKNTQVHATVPLGGYSVGGTINPRKPLNSTLEANIPVSVYYVPLNIGIRAPLKNPLKARATVSLPLPGMNLRLISISPMSLLHISRNIKHIAHNVEKAVNRICRFGRKSHKARRRAREKREFLKIAKTIHNEIVKTNFLASMPGIEKLPEISGQMAENCTLLQTILQTSQEQTQTLPIAVQAMNNAHNQMQVQLQRANAQMMQNIGAIQLTVQAFQEEKDSLENAKQILAESIAAHKNQLTAMQERVNALTILKDRISPERLAELRANARKNEANKNQ